MCDKDKEFFYIFAISKKIKNQKSKIKNEKGFR